jgi:thioredoxin 1
MSGKKSESRLENLNEELKTKAKSYVLFYATWCPHSQRFLPIFEEYAKTNPKECIKVTIDDKPELCEKYHIEYYPTVIVFEQGRIKKRLDATPGTGLTREQLKDFTSKP